MLHKKRKKKLKILKPKFQDQRQVKLTDELYAETVPTKPTHKTSSTVIKIFRF